MHRKACGSPALMVAGELSDDLEVESAYSLANVFGWLQEYPEQIVGAVFTDSANVPGD